MWGIDLGPYLGAQMSDCVAHSDPLAGLPKPTADGSYWSQCVEFAIALGQAYPEPRGFITGDWSVEYPPIAEHLAAVDIHAGQVRLEHRWKEGDKQFEVYGFVPDTADGRSQWAWASSEVEGHHRKQSGISSFPAAAMRDSAFR